ncbi:hypothetical protein EDC96DRAFT_239777 [Choanephora cucurbitarum]|nr:hypothetical protein EDC96DRAFT_239777 [Choanephora cucurbitarum]
MEPLQVHFRHDSREFERLESQISRLSDNVQETGDSQSDNYDYDSSEKELEGLSGYDTFLILPCPEEVETFMIVPETDQEIESLVDDIEDQPTSESVKAVLLKKRVEECEDLTKEERTQLLNLFLRYLDVLGVDYKDLKQTHLVKLHIDTGDHEPILKKPNKYMSHSELETLKAEFAKMLKKKDK